MNDDRSRSTGQDARATADTAMDEALGWAIRMDDPDTADWDAFTMWLERDPLHADRYDRVVSALRDAEQAVARVPAASAENMPGQRVSMHVRPDRPPLRLSRWVGGAVTAAVVGAIGVGLWSGADRSYAVETAAGQQRELSLPDGTKVMLAGGSRITLDRSDGRYAAVERGQVLFHVRHDARRPFRVTAGTVTLTDLGTVFDVRTADRHTRVAVGQGAVRVDLDGRSLRLDPGQAAVVDDQTMQRETIDAASVGSWREGRLTFDNVVLADVASDLSRTLAIRITAAPSVERRVFRGTLDAAQLKDNPELLGALLGVEVRRDGAGWTLDAHR